MAGLELHLPKVPNPEQQGRARTFDKNAAHPPLQLILTSPHAPGMLSLYHRIFPRPAPPSSPPDPPTMRLRLTIRRHELPVTKILFSHTSASAPVSQLLSAVNESVPLESDGWGLEDYVVSVAGFECLHYQPVSSVLCEDDEVEIRALGSEDVKARRVGGRYQISQAGIRLVDGLPFGRSQLKRVSRPSVRIPPLKRRRLLEEDDEGPFELVEQEEVEEQGGVRQVRIRAGFEDADAEEDGETSGIAPKINFMDAELPDDEDDEESEDFQPPGEEDSDGEDSESSQSQDSDDDDDIDAHASESSSSPFSSSSSESSDDDSSSSEESDDSEGTGLSDLSSTLIQAPPEEMPSTRKVLAAQDSSARHASVEKSSELPVPPGQGKRATRKRNERRLKARLRMKEEKKQQAQAEMALPDFDGEEAKTNDSKKMAAVSNKIIFDADGQQDLETSTVLDQSIPTPEIGPQATLKPVETPGRRKLDLAASQRLLFGSLGVRRPKTSTDAAKVRAKLAGTPNKTAISPAGKVDARGETAEAVVEPSGLDAWKEKINLRAVETVYEAITLSTPPFPFVQRWDPQQQSGKKRKRQPSDLDGYNEEQYWEPVEQGLNYDEADVDTSYVTDNVATDLQVEEDLPRVPESVDDLAQLTINDCFPGTVIVFKRLEISTETTFGPSVSPIRTAIVESADGGYLQLRLALRDCPQKEIHYDDEGHRVYGRFEAPVDDEDEAGEGTNANDRYIEVEFDELIDPRILVAAPMGNTSKTEALTGENTSGMEPQDSLDSNIVVPDSISQPAQPRTLASTSSSHASDSQRSSEAAKRNASSVQGMRNGRDWAQAAAASLAETDYGTLNMDDFDEDVEGAELMHTSLVHSAVDARAG